MLDFLPPLAQDVIKISVIGGVLYMIWFITFKSFSKFIETASLNMASQSKQLVDAMQAQFVTQATALRESQDRQTVMYREMQDRLTKNLQEIYDVLRTQIRDQAKVEIERKRDGEILAQLAETELMLTQNMMELKSQGTHIVSAMHNMEQFCRRNNQ